MLLLKRKKKHKLVPKEKIQYLIFTGLSLCVILIGMLSEKSSYRRYFGDISPILIFVLVSISGIILLSYLLKKEQLKIYNKSKKGLLLSAGLTVPFLLVIILLDLKVVFPGDLNIFYPQSLLFYPVIAYIVEIIFHILPLSILFFLSSLFTKRNSKIILWVTILIVSLVEPVYQTIFNLGKYSLLTVIYISLHIFLINLVQVKIYQKYDFISMYSFRLVYYLLWHVLWGYIRLEILF